MTESDQEKEKTNNLKNEITYGRSTRNYNDFMLFNILDRGYRELINFPEGKNKKSSFSRLIYVIGAVIFLVGAIEGSVAAQFTKFRSLNDWQLYGLVLITALVTAIVFAGFGKAVELIIYRSNKP